MTSSAVDSVLIIHAKAESRNVLPVSQAEWTFLSNHGHVLVSLAKDPEARMRDVAEAVGITERAVQQIVRDLVLCGYVHKEKAGRRNRYAVIRGAHFRHDLEAGLTLGEFLDLIVSQDGHAPVHDRTRVARGHVS